MLRFANLLCLIFALVFITSLVGASLSQAQENTNTNKLNINKLVEHNDTPLRIAVAANFTPVLKVLLRDFTQETGIKIQLISGASGAMFLQIKHGAPFDIFGAQFGDTFAICSVFLFVFSPMR